MKNIIFFLSVILLGSCGNKNVSSTTDNALAGEYLLKSVQGKDLTSEALMVNFDLEAQRVYGETGCNGFSAQYTQNGSELTITAPISTRMFCEGKMETEQAIHAAVEKVAKFEQNGKDLTFYSAENEALFSLTKTNN